MSIHRRHVRTSWRGGAAARSLPSRDRDGHPREHASYRNASREFIGTTLDSGATLAYGVPEWLQEPTVVQSDPPGRPFSCSMTMRTSDVSYVTTSRDPPSTRSGAPIWNQRSAAWTSVVPTSC